MIVNDDCLSAIGMFVVAVSSTGKNRDAASYIRIEAI